jgi:2-polyprenyl-3-methyl-5-hydroxy-6-metoxy-1,4-benzoquinol methylase
VGASPTGDHKNADDRGYQLAYSDLMSEMHDEQGRRRKAAKMAAVLEHFLRVPDLSGLRLLDVGCSTGYVTDELARRGAEVVGIDIDEPGLARAKQVVGDRAALIACSADAVPLPSASFDVIVFNHVYEHVPDPDAVMDEIRRLLKPNGVVYLAFGNKLGIIEPHYRLPFLSWLPKGVAHKYVRRAGKADEYYETFRTKSKLRRMAHDLTVWDYTFTILNEPDRFAADDLVPRWLRNLPPAAWRALAPIVPTFVWIGTPNPALRPLGGSVKVGPDRLGARRGPAQGR